MNDRATHQERLDWLAGLVQSPSTGECVLWPGAVNHDGYPLRFSMAHGIFKQPSHVVMEMTGSPRPSGAHEILHACDRPACVAPWHLRWGTHQENHADMVAKGRNSTHTPSLSHSAAAEIRAAAATGISGRELARRHGVHHSTIQQVLRGEIWRNR